MPKGEDRLTDKVNTALENLEKEGQAEKIYDRWFGPETKSAQPRGDFKIGPVETSKS